MDNQKYILISGTGRSGTTIIKQLLSQHPLISFVKGREPRVFSDPPTVFELLDVKSPYEQDKLIKEILKKYKSLYRGNLFDAAYGKYYREKLSAALPYYLARRYQGVNLNKYYPDMMKDLEVFFSSININHFNASYIGTSLFEKRKMYCTNCDSDTLEREISKYIKKYISNLSNGTNCIIEDNPFGFYTQKHFQKALGSNFVPFFIIRDPRDIVASSINTSWAPSDVRGCSAYIKKILNDYLLVAKDINLIKLEEFIKNPNRYLNSILNMTGLESYDFDCSDVNDKSTGRFNKLDKRDVEFLNEYFTKELKHFSFID